MSILEGLANVITNPVFYFTVITVTAPILFATLGCSVAQKADATNMGMEGIMMISSFVGVVVSHFTNSTWLGLLASVIAGTLMGLFVAYFALVLKVNIILVGIALNLIGPGITAFFCYVLSGDRSTTAAWQTGRLPSIDIPGVKDIPVLGDIISGQPVLVYIAFILVAVCSFFLYKTRTGLRIRAVGENPNAASSVGLSVNKTKTIALAISGMLGGFGGAFLSTCFLSYFTIAITSGRGFVALAACTMGGATPLGSLLTSLLFGFFYGFANFSRALGIPDQLLTMLPYVAVIVGLVIYSVVRQRNELKKLKRGSGK